MSCLVVTLTQKQTGLTANLVYENNAITVNIGRVCDVFVRYPLYAADSRLYAADGPLFVSED